MPAHPPPSAVQALARACSREACRKLEADLAALHAMQRARPLAPPCRFNEARPVTAAQRDAARYEREAAGAMFVST